MRIYCKNAEGVAIEGALVKAKPIGAGNEPVYSGSGGVLVKEVAEHSAATTGLVTLSLPANSTLIPANSYYRISIQAPGERKARVAYILVPNGAGPYDVEDVLHEPGTVDESALAAHIATIKTHGDWSDTSPSAGQVPIWDGTNWTPGDTVATDIEAAALVTAHAADTTDAHDASAVSFVPEFAGSLSLAEDDVQGALTYVQRALAPSWRHPSERLTRGLLGTAGKGAVAFRFDHHLDPLRATIWPLYKARYLPGGLAMYTEAFTREPDSATTTWNDIHTLVAEGMEIWSHSVTHQDPAHAQSDGLYDEVVNSRLALEAQGLRVQGWMMPGTSTPEGQYPYGMDDSVFSGFDSEAGRLLMATYPIAEADGPGAMRALPTGPAYGFGHFTAETQTLTSLKHRLDFAIKMQLGVEFMTHANWIGQPGYISLADYTAFLDYVASERDAGRLEVVTPSGLYFADPGSSRRLNLVSDGSFAGLTPSATGLWTGAGSMLFPTDGGRTGTTYMRVPATQGTAIHNHAYIQSLDLGGHVFLAEGWCRAPSGSATARLRLMDNDDTSRLNVDNTLALSAGSTWTRMRHVFTMPLATENFSIRVGRNGGDIVDWDDVSVVKL